MQKHPYLSLHHCALFGLLNNRSWETLRLRGGVRSGPKAASAASPALLNFFTAFQTAASPSHFPITGQLRRLISTGLLETPSRGWSGSRDWWRLVGERAGAHARCGRRLTSGRVRQQITPVTALWQKVGNCDHRLCFSIRRQWKINLSNYNLLHCFLYRDGWGLKHNYANF